MLILNTGGTFNKRYNPLTGALDVPYDNHAVEAVLQALHVSSEALAGVVYKDSLDMDANDRKMIASIILESHERDVVIVHGTDTMHLTATVLAGVIENRRIVITGAMVPWSIDPVEASANLAMALGFLQGGSDDGVYICMSGMIAPHDQITKNRSKGVFERV